MIALLWGEVPLATSIHQRGRTLEKLGIKSISVSELMDYVNKGLRE